MPQPQHDDDIPYNNSTGSIEDACKAFRDASSLLLALHGAQKTVRLVHNPETEVPTLEHKWTDEELNTEYTLIKFYQEFDGENIEHHELVVNTVYPDGQSSYIAYQADTHSRTWGSVTYKETTQMKTIRKAREAESEKHGHNKNWNASYGADKKLKVYVLLDEADYTLEPLMFADLLEAQLGK